MKQSNADRKRKVLDFLGLLQEIVVLSAVAAALLLLPFFGFGFKTAMVTIAVVTFTGLLSFAVCRSCAAPRAGSDSLVEWNSKHFVRTNESPRPDPWWNNAEQNGEDSRRLM